MKILVLYTRLTGYWMACMRHDHARTGNTYLVFRTPPSAEAPFKIKSEDGIEVLDFNKEQWATLEQHARAFAPDVIYVSGWTNKRYLNLALAYKLQNVPVVLGMDNHWLGTLKQRLAGLLSPWLVKKYVTHIWVPGLPQYRFAQQLGFRPKHILTGLYCADDSLFKSIAQEEHQRQLLFVGRVVEHKGVKVLFRAVEELIAEGAFDIQLHIIGNGPLVHLIPKHPNVMHTPFMAPEALTEAMSNAGTFILPSLYEAWGVVVHEAALAGLPIISTYQCGAASEFVINGFNGYRYDAKDVDALKHIIRQVAQQSAAAYVAMSQNSRHLGGHHTLEDWSAKINSLKHG
ncbi:glycosyltransferase [uncultured Winogradskyella sp.]|uniref:glycosyltransferase n=1 Tax=uncultured Winogradskyella sp. TaxID=395353 RepID=UPI0035196C6A